MPPMGQTLGASAFQELSESCWPEHDPAAGALVEATRPTGGWFCLAEEG